MYCYWVVVWQWILVPTECHNAAFYSSCYTHWVTNLMACCIAWLTVQVISAMMKNQTRKSTYLLISLDGDLNGSQYTYLSPFLYDVNDTFSSLIQANFTAEERTIYLLVINNAISSLLTDNGNPCLLVYPFLSSGDFWLVLNGFCSYKATILPDKSTVFLVSSCSRTEVLLR